MSDEQDAVDGIDSLKTLIDGDGLSDSQESHYGTNPLVADMKGDGNLLLMMSFDRVGQKQSLPNLMLLATTQILMMIMLSIALMRFH